MKRQFEILLAVLFCLGIIASAGAIELVGPTEPLAVGEIVDFSVDGMTDADLANSDVTHFPREKVRVKPYLTWGKQPMIEFSARRPGKYLVKVTIAKNGTLETDEVIVTVAGEDDEPDPFPQPEPIPENLAVVIVSESSTRTPAEAVLHERLRDYLKSKSIPWRIVDPDIVDRLDNVPTWYSEIKQKTVTATLPLIVLSAPRPDGVYSVVAVKPLTTYEAAVKTIEGGK